MPPLCNTDLSDSGAHVTQIMDLHFKHICSATGCGTKKPSPWKRQRTMTQVPKAWGFNDRGVLAEGKAADINVFDASTVSPNMPELLHDLQRAPPASNSDRIRCHYRERRSTRRKRRAHWIDSRSSPSRSVSSVSSWQSGDLLDFVFNCTKFGEARVPTALF